MPPPGGGSMTGRLSGELPASRVLSSLGQVTESKGRRTMFAPITLQELHTGELLTAWYEGPEHPAYPEAVAELKRRGELSAADEAAGAHK